MEKAFQQKVNRRMIKKFLVAVIAGMVLGSAGAALMSLNDLKTKLDTTPTEVSNANLDTGMFLDVITQPESDKVLESVNDAGVKTIDLTDGNFVLVYGPIMQNGNEIADHIKKATQKGEPLYVLIDSPGGSVISGGAIISAIEASPVPVYTVCLQLCASMGAMIHQYGTERYTVNRSLLMFHDAAGGFIGPFQQVASQMNMINRFVNKMFANAAKRSKQNYKEFVSRIGAEIWIDGEDAVTQKYSDGIVNVIFDENKAVNPPSQELLILRNTSKSKMLDISYIK
jgi:ATP-dependent Clp protease protease subunit